MVRNELLDSAAKSLYRYAVAVSHATHDGRRPGIQLPSIAPTMVKSCGAFRDWAIHAHDGGVCFSIDGYAVRGGRESGSVGILVGDGRFLFPHDDSRSMHSLRMGTTDGARIVFVTSEDEIKWESRIAAMRNTLEAAAEVVEARVKAYDLQQQIERQEARREELAGAHAALAK